MSQKYLIQTFGCQMNVADTEKMEALLQGSGFTRASDSSEADLILINGCSVREKAVHKAVSALGRINATMKKQNRKPILGLGGCVGQMEKTSLFENAPYLDFVFGPDAIDELPDLVFRVQNGERHFAVTEFDKKKTYSTETKIYGKKAQAFVNIMKGCDKFCTYCIVPFTRGREKSRTIDEVLDDLAQLMDQGVTEVTLLGQNVNSFGKGNLNTKQRKPLSLSNVIGKVGPKEGEENFPQLLRAIDSDPRLSQIRRIRFTSSHPLDFSDELIECYGPVEKGGISRLAQHLHLPVQSGSNAVLRKMGRHHQIEHYIAQMKRLKELCPEVGISTDLIVGFPTETEEDFQQTLRLLDEIEYDSLYAFAYSSRPGTRAAKLEDNVSHEVKMRRLNDLLAYQSKVSEKKYSYYLGKVKEVLVEGRAKNQILISKRSGFSDQAQVWTGRTSCNRVVNFIFDSPRDITGQYLDVKINQSSPLALCGEVEEEFLNQVAPVTPMVGASL